MLEKIKHSKFKNTAIIYQVLIRKMIQQASNKQKIYSYNIIKNFFNKNSEMSKQLYLYSLISQSKQIQSQNKANTLIDKIMQMRIKLDDIRLQKQKYLCIKQIKNNYQLKQLFNTKLQNYRLFASIYKLFQSLKKNIYDPSNIVQSKYIIIQNIMKNRQNQKDTLIQNFKKQTNQMKQQILQLLIQKFSNQYQDNLNQKQKQLLTKYILCLSDAKPLDQYIENQKDTLVQSMKNLDIFKENQEKQKLNYIIQNLDNLTNIKDTKTKVYILMNVYQILK